ncbi:MAG: IS66 family insertion sequence element accessory protein TnpB [Deltaproteobacteria bacterium]|nr:IS66 family insertion sequence element accessory protein TnpB [Deltaproteobacteria bacterium]
MIGAERRVRVFARAAPTDMRKSFDTLSALVSIELGRDPLEGDMFLFVGARLRSAKVLFWDGTGLCVFPSGSRKGGSRRPGSGAPRARSPCPGANWISSSRAASWCSSERCHRARLFPRESQLAPSSYDNFLAWWTSIASPILSSCVQSPRFKMRRSGASASSCCW